MYKGQEILVISGVLLPFSILDCESR